MAVAVVVMTSSMFLMARTACTRPTERPMVAPARPLLPGTQAAPGVCYASRSAVIREALERLLNEASAHPDSCLALASDLIGSVEGPADLSHNKKHLEGFGT